VAIVINGRYIHATDIHEIEPGVWELTIYEHYKGQDVTVKRVMYGNAQCEVCRLPLQAGPGECQKCNDCLHALGRFEQGRLQDPLWIRDIHEYLKDRRAQSRRR